MEWLIFIKLKKARNLDQHITEHIRSPHVYTFLRRGVHCRLHFSLTMIEAAKNVIGPLALQAFTGSWRITAEQINRWLTEEVLKYEHSYDSLLASPKA